MQKTRNIFFGSKINNTTLHQSKTGKRESRNITAMYLGTRAYLFSREVFLTRNNCCKFLASYDVMIQSNI